jgi:FMN phosphatase YigB (HAD superfamily)
MAAVAPVPAPALAGVPWSRVRLVVFDVDGTLYDQRPLRRRMRRALLAHCLSRPRDLGLLRTLQTFRRLREELAEEASEGISRLQYERPAALLGLSPEAVRLAVETWMHERPLPYLQGCRFPGVERVFEALRASGRTTAVFSDYPAEAKMRALGLRADLYVAATDADIERLKPHPLGLQRTLERAGAAPAESLFIGDRDERDGECARRLGVPYLLKTRKPTGAPAEFQEYAELLPYLSSDTASR